MLDWFVVQTNPQREMTAADRLADYEPYCPRFKAPTGKVRPLFPGYLFCQATEFWSSIQNAVGVRSILMRGDVPARLSNGVVSYWRNREVAGLVQLPDPPRFHAGDRLLVTKGMLTRHVVIHTGMSAKDRELVLVRLLGADVRISVSAEDLVSEQEQHTKDRLRQRREGFMRGHSRRFP